MIRYIPVLNPQAADKLSRSLWVLSRPTTVQASDVTKRLFTFITATDGTIWLQTETTATLPIHQLAELAGILEVMQPLIDGGQLPASAPTNLAAVITASKGTPLNIYGILPAFFTNRSKTKEELLTLGLLKEVKL